MAKRLTDSRKWDDDWFLGLSNEHRLLWIYLLDKCDYAGIFKPNMKLLNFCLNSNYQNGDLYEIFKDRIKKLKDDKIFIPKFIVFQYGTLNKESAFHSKIIKYMKEQGVDRVSTGCRHSIDRPNVKVNVNSNKEGVVKGKQDPQDFVGALKANPAYSHIDIDTELGKMDAWLLAHKGRQKTKKFVVNWLNKIEKPIGITKPRPAQTPYKAPDQKQYSTEPPKEFKDMVKKLADKKGIK